MKCLIKFIITLLMIFPVTVVLSVVGIIAMTLVFSGCIEIGSDNDPIQKFVDLVDWWRDL